MTRDEILVWCGVIIAVGAAITVLWKFACFLWKLGRNAGHFFDDWNGTPTIPGVIKRLDNQDTQTEQVIARLARVEWHVGNGSPIALRQVVESNCAAIGDLMGIVGTRTRDKKLPVPVKTKG